jgi:hypothetical protein
MTMRLTALLVLTVISAGALAADPPAATNTWDASTTTAAAMGYCLAKHPYQTLRSNNIGSFTRDGYEVVSTPGVVGAVRRNFVFDRSIDTADEGVKNSCKDACSEFGKLYRGLSGRPLRQKIGASGAVITSGIGDMASLVVKDIDFYLGGQVPAGVWSRGNTWHESDVAQSDFCCCQVTGASARAVVQLPPPGTAPTK